jgi:hypothetical protein
MVNQNCLEAEKYDFCSQRYVLTRYGDVDKFTEADDTLQRELQLKGRALVQTTKKANDLFDGVNSCNLAISYLCDDFVSFQGAFIIRADNIPSGSQARDLLEHCLNTHGRMATSPFYKPQKFGDIEFLVNETKSEPKVYHVVTGANHPEIVWREMYSIILAPQVAIKQTGLLEKLRRLVRK